MDDKLKFIIENQKLVFENLAIVHSLLTTIYKQNLNAAKLRLDEDPKRFVKDHQTEFMFSFKDLVVNTITSKESLSGLANLGNNEIDAIVRSYLDERESIGVNTRREFQKHWRSILSNKKSEALASFCEIVLALPKIIDQVRSLRLTSRL